MRRIIRADVDGLTRSLPLTSYLVS